MKNHTTKFFLISIFIVVTGCGRETKSTPEDGVAVDAGSINVIDSPNIGGERTCNANDATFWAEAFILSNPVITSVNELQKFVEMHKDELRNDSPLINCASLVGRKLLDKGASMYSRDDQTRVYNNMISIGTPAHEATRIANEFNAGAYDAMMIGEELIWLAEVLPQAAEGNWTPYQTTGSERRKAARDYVALMRSLDGLMEPGTSEQISGVMKQYGPEMKQAVLYIILLGMK
jgi:hypothetical protein